MTFASLLLALACSCYCLEASRAFAAGPAAYTTITDRIDIMGAVETAQENNAGDYGGQNIYAEHGGHMIMSNSEIPDTDTHLTSPDASHPSNIFSEINFHRFPSVSGVKDTIGPAISYIASSGSSVSISSAGPSIRVISYSTPGRISVSHGLPGSSYIISTHRQPQTQIQAQKAVSFSSSPGDNLKDQNHNSGAKLTPPEISASVPFFSGLQNDAGITIFGIPNGKLSITSITDPIDVEPLAATGILHGNPHLARAVASRNLQAARQVVDGISAAVSRAVNINLAGITAAQF